MERRSRSCLVLPSADRTILVAPRGPCPSFALAHRLREPIVEVADDVGNALDADRKAHHIGPGAGGDLLLLVELAMRRRRGMDDERAGVADIGEMREELDALD